MYGNNSAKEEGRSGVIQEQSSCEVNCEKIHILIPRATTKKVSQKIVKIQLRDKMFQNRASLILLPNWTTMLNEIQYMLS